MHKPRKGLGQHFLSDKNIIQRIVDVLAPKSDQHLVEIGPGQGALTLPVLKQAKKLEVIELDQDLIPPLKERCAHAGQLLVHHGDVLEFDFRNNHTSKLRIFGNLPYNISTPLLFHLISFQDIIADMLFMLQKEVAERIVASPSTEDYGRLSVMIQYHCEVALLFDVPPQAFFPPPQVYSSIIRLRPHVTVPYPAKNYELFAEIVKHAFGQRRKTLRNSLKQLVPDTIWEQISVHSNQRAENLSVADYVEISNAISGS